jgi:hypothetical protein
MVNPSLSPAIAPLLALLREYSFDIDNYQPEALISEWLDQFGPVWVGHAITEALYQGRYKMVSVDYILQLWHRRGAPLRHFNREFESIILGQTLLASPETSTELPASPRPAGTAGRGHTNTTTATGSPDLETLVIWPAPSPSVSVPNFRPLEELTPSRVASTAIDRIPPFVPPRQTTGLHQRLRSVVRADLGP